MKEGGALFCDGQFVNASNTKSCADELNAKLKFDIDIDVKGSVNGAVDATKDAGEDICSVGAVGGPNSGGTGAAALLGLCATVLGFQRSRKRRGSDQQR
jgi:hypothetical protein